MLIKFINVFTNVPQTQSILPCVPYDETTIVVFLNWHFEYKLFYMLGNVHLNMVVFVLQDLIKTL
jgi:hypothetical protein